MMSVLVGMSGGVDSSAAALMLMPQYQVSGATMKLFEHTDICHEGSRTCCAINDVEDARRVCNRLGIEHHVFNFRDGFHQHVIARFAEGYAQGETPNPCIDCNRFVKFPYLLKRADQLGFDYIATGHYARISRDGQSGRYLLMRGLDSEKDQSYVLYAMSQAELSRTLFPLGNQTKAQIRALAVEHGLVTADKPDSQDICFVPDGNYGAFLTEKMGIPSEPGDVLDESGQILGRHRGLIHYTIGQRRGLGIAASTPLYVTGKELSQNTLTLGKSEDLMDDGFIVRDANWIAIKALDAPMDVTVMTRYRDRETDALLYPLESGDVFVQLSAAKRAITPGQAAVFYQGDTVIGGGVISAKIKNGNQIRYV